MAIARLIVEGQASPHFAHTGVENMAIDETLLRTAASESITTLRFYGWQPATLTLGYFQNINTRSSHAPSSNCDLVRRASGGGAILHDNELTYCFATPTQSRFGNAEEYYFAFHETLVELLAEHDVTAKLHRKEDGLTDEAFLCFKRRAVNDVTLDGHKIAGSAQRRWKNGLVQHGSILLEQSSFAPELSGIRDLASFSTTTESLIATWAEKLSSRLNLTFEVDQLTDRENDVCNQLQSEKFSSDRWNMRR